MSKKQMNATSQGNAMRGEEQFETWWIQLGNNWICTASKQEFYANQRNAVQCEKRVSYFKDGRWIETLTIPINKEDRNERRSKK